MKGWSDLACGIALDAVRCVHIEEKGGYKEIDIKRYAKVTISHGPWPENILIFTIFSHVSLFPLSQETRYKHEVVYLLAPRSPSQVEKVPGGSIEESQILDGVMFNKDVTHTGMKRKIENPR